MTFRAHELMSMLAREPDSQQYDLVASAIKFDMGSLQDFNEIAQLSKMEFIRAPVSTGLYQVGDNVFLLARDDGDEVMVNFFHIGNVTGGVWSWLDCCCKVAHDSKNNVVACVFNGFNGDGGVVGESEMDASDTYLFKCACTLAMSFEVFACSNVKTIENTPPKFINAKRIAKGKVPFFSYRTLHIIAGEEKSKQTSAGQSHASPRLHLRRGHIRRLADRRIWVSASLVGDKSKGFADKEYSVKPLAQ